MRNHPPRILVLATFFTALASATAIVPVASPAMAKPSAATFDAEFQSIRQEMKDLWLEMHNFKPLPKYCRPPLEPMKIPHNSVMQMFGARTQALMARFRANKQSLQDFLAGNYELEKELMLNGVSPRERNYWRDNKYQLEAERLQKEQKLAWIALAMGVAFISMAFFWTSLSPPHHTKVAADSAGK